MRFCAAMLIVMVFASCAAAAEVPVERIQSAIEQLVEKILPCQAKDGSFTLGADPNPQNAQILAQFPQGQTALAVMALQYARPHLKGDLRNRAIEACQKAVANIAQQRLEPRTYSAALIITVLYQENPERYRKHIDAYATMLALGQHDKGDTFGQWGYRLPLPKGVPGDKEQLDLTWGDASNTQFALLGLYNAMRSGYQVPKAVWQRAAEHYAKTQFLDGGWGYKPDLRPQPYMNMTVASTISLELCEEMLGAAKHAQCKAPTRSKAVQAGLDWIALQWEASEVGSDAYGLYALERLGILMGRANIGGHDWFNEGAERLLSGGRTVYTGTPEMASCFAIAFLARGLEPIVINKLERRDTDDWNNDPYDVKHLVEYLQDRHQLSVQWRIVTLGAPQELLDRTPILYVSGHDKIELNDYEKRKLIAYVENGGTVLAQCCCSRKEFDKSIRALTLDLFGAEFEAFPKSSRIFERMKSRGVNPNPDVLFAPIKSQGGRPGVIYLPNDLCCRWHTGTGDARASSAAGAGIYFYVVNEGKRMYEESRPKPAAPATPEPPKPPPETPPTPPAPPVPAPN